MIGNPFNFNILVSAIKLDDDISVISITDPDNTLTLPDLYSYAGIGTGYVTVTQLKPNEAYWVNNISGRSLKLLFPPTAAPAPAINAIKPVSAGESPPEPPSREASADPENCFIATASYKGGEYRKSDAGHVGWIDSAISYLHEIIF